MGLVCLKCAISCAFRISSLKYVRDTLCRCNRKCIMPWWQQSSCELVGITQHLRLITTAALQKRRKKNFYVPTNMS